MKQLLSEYRKIKRPRNVGLISVSHGINEFYGLAFPPIIPILVTDLGISYTQAGLLLTVFYVMYSVFQLPAGIVGDRIGKARLLIWGLLGMAAALVLASTAQTYEMLLVAQGIMGISGSTYHPAGMAMLSDTETKETEGKAMGVFGLGGMIGVASAPIIIGGLASVIGWRTALAVAAALGFVVTVVFKFSYRTPTQTQRTVEDGGTREIVENSETKTIADGERDAKSPTDESEASGPFDRRGPGAKSWLHEVFGFELTANIAFLCLVVLLVSLQIRSIQTFATSFLVDGVGRSTSTANGIFFVMLAASAVSSIWVGGLADRFDRGLLGVVAAVATSVLLFAVFVVFLLEAAIVGWLLTGLLGLVFGLLGLAVYGCTPIKNAIISEYASADSSGSLFGVTQTASAVGSAAGPVTFGHISTEFGIGYAFPMIAVIGTLIAVGFYTLSRT